MALEATYRHSEATKVDWTASATTVAGQIVVLGNTTGITNGIAQRDIANAELGTLEVGGGVYDVKVASNYAAWTKVYWDDANAVLTSTSTNMSLFGYTVEAAAAANAVVEVLHAPRA